MSGARLCATLADLGYEGWQLLDADSFEWPFQYEETRPLLNFLCTNLRPSNALTLPELLQYNELKAEGKLLEGEDLDFAYGSISAFASMRSNQEAILGTEESLKEIKESTAAYQSEALGLQKHIQLLQSRLESLGGQTSSLIQWRRARAAAASSTANNVLVVEEKLAARNLEMNTVLEKLSSSARELSYYHSGEEDGIFISFADLQPYTSQDQAYTKQLRDWFSKQFDVGPSRLVAELGKSKCSSEALDEVTNHFVKGDLERAYHRRFVELQRLRSIFGVSERQWVEAHVEKAKQQAVLLMAQSQATADQAHVHSDLQTLRRKQTDIGGELYALSRKEDKLLSEVIPSLCWDLAQLQDTYTLQGDYDLKVMRQEYYISQQKKFIGFLVDQLARHRFLQVASHLERKTTSSAYELLRLVEADLQAYTQITSGRIDGCVGLAVVGAEAHEHGAVDDRDTFLHRMNRVVFPCMFQHQDWCSKFCSYRQSFSLCKMKFTILCFRTNINASTTCAT
ncbi:hypothetical protein CY35_04G002800 [Sphagnum magellanicum]|nr:hypothetical protein CY35_04G002800 [Sphagnum magellanicum]